MRVGGLVEGLERAKRNKEKSDASIEAQLQALERQAAQLEQQVP